MIQRLWNIYEQFSIDQRHSSGTIWQLQDKSSREGQAQKVFAEAWSTCLTEARQWYEGRCKHVQSMCRFYYGVKSETDFLEIVQCGHWKVDLLNHRVTEKGLDSRMAVDMVTKLHSYDIALVVCGDADAIPSISEAQSHGKHVGVIEFLSGYPPEKREEDFHRN